MGLLQVSLNLVWCWLLVCCILLLLCLGMGLDFLTFLRILSWRGIGFCQMLSQHLMRWSCGVFLWVCLYSRVHWWIFMTNYPSIPEKKPTWSLWIIILMCSWIKFVRILLSVFASIFLREIGLKFSFFVGSLCGLEISIIVSSKNKLGSVPSVSILWNSLESIGIRSSLMIWQNSALNPYGLGFYWLGYF